MKSRVLARPDLKLFLLAGLLVVGIHSAASKRPDPESGSQYPTLGKNQVYPESEFRKLLEKAASEPDSATFYKLTSHYLNKGDRKKALFFMKCAEEIQVWEDDPETF